MTFGKVVIAQVMPAEFRKALEFSLERSLAALCIRELLGIDHCEVGALLLELGFSGQPD